MIELYPNISKETRDQAELAWTIAYYCKTAGAAAAMLDAFTNYYCSLHKEQEEEIRDFLHFYFNLKLSEAENFKEKKGETDD